MDICDDLRLARLGLRVAVNPGADRDVTETPRREGLAGTCPSRCHSRAGTPRPGTARQDRQQPPEEGHGNGTADELDEAGRAASTGSSARPATSGAGKDPQPGRQPVPHAVGRPLPVERSAAGPGPQFREAKPRAAAEETGVRTLFGSGRWHERRKGQEGGREATRYQRRQRVISMGDDTVAGWLHDAVASGGGT